MDRVEDSISLADMRSERGQRGSWDLFAPRGGNFTPSLRPLELEHRSRSETPSPSPLLSDPEPPLPCGARGDLWPAQSNQIRSDSPCLAGT